MNFNGVVVDTTKVQFFKQITTGCVWERDCNKLLLTPQRYNFSSKSQLLVFLLKKLTRCCWHHKGTIFQANHNSADKLISCVRVVVDTTKVQFFKQITTCSLILLLFLCCCWHHKGTIFQANHNVNAPLYAYKQVVVDTTKVQFFKQITTLLYLLMTLFKLLLTPQRYNFSSKSQRISWNLLLSHCCCWHHKGTIFQANHNAPAQEDFMSDVVVDTTKVQFFKQITTKMHYLVSIRVLLLTPQRYNFSSKSQRSYKLSVFNRCCCWHHKGTIFQANHNLLVWPLSILIVVVDTTKVQFFKQITTDNLSSVSVDTLLLTPQRYNFSSKSQPLVLFLLSLLCCCWHHKGTIFQANHNDGSVDVVECCVVVDTTKVQFFKQITT